MSSHDLSRGLQHTS